MNGNLNEPTDREEIEHLLPWHAAGTLSRRDAGRVEEALARDPELARRFALVREELGETIHLNETLGAPSARAMDKLMAGIEAESGPAPAAAGHAASRFSLTAWVSERLAVLSPRTLAYAATIGALALVLQFGILTGVAVNGALSPQSSGFATASGDPSAALAEAGSFALIGFVADADVDAVTGFLAANDLTIVDGPRAGGIYRLRIAGPRLPEAEAEAVIARLRGESAIVAFIALTE